MDAIHRKVLHIQSQDARMPRRFSQPDQRQIRIVGILILVFISQCGNAGMSLRISMLHSKRALRYRFQQLLARLAV